MSRDQGNEKRQGDDHEEWQAGDPGYLPHLWNKNVQDRQELRVFPWYLGQGRDISYITPLTFIAVVLLLNAELFSSIMSASP
jgi:hypothetical protein